MIQPQMLLVTLFSFSREIDEEALEQALSAAVTCTILAAAGPQRSRVLATLYKVKFFLVIDLFIANGIYIILEGSDFKYVLSKC